MSSGALNKSYAFRCGLTSYETPITSPSGPDHVPMRLRSDSYGNPWDPPWTSEGKRGRSVAGWPAPGRWLVSPSQAPATTPIPSTGRNLKFDPLPGPIFSAALGVCFGTLKGNVAFSPAGGKSTESGDEY